MEEKITRGVNMDNVKKLIIFLKEKRLQDLMEIDELLLDWKDDEDKKNINDINDNDE